MKTIRKSAFETNSSSTHSISLCSSDAVIDQTLKKVDGKINFSFVPFSDEINKTEHKLNYILTNICGKRDFDLIIDVIKEVTGATEVNIEDYDTKLKDDDSYNYSDSSQLDEDDEDSSGWDGSGVWLEAIFADREKLKKFLFSSKSCLDISFDG